MAFNAASTLGLANPEAKSVSAKVIASILGVTSPAIMGFTLQWSGQWHENQLTNAISLLLKVLVCGALLFSLSFGVSYFDGFYFAIQICTSMGMGASEEIYDTRMGKFVTMLYGVISMSALASVADYFLKIAIRMSPRVLHVNDPKIPGLGLLSALWTKVSGLGSVWRKKRTPTQRLAVKRHVSTSTQSTPRGYRTKETPGPLFASGPMSQ